VKTVLFASPGPENTEAAIASALDRAQELGVRDFVVASNTGATARVLLEALAERGMEGANVVVVTHHVGFRSPGEDEMDQDTRRRLAAAGAKVLTTTHLMGGIERAVTGKFGGLYPGHLVAHTLRLFGQGVKVAVEIAVMALDAGLIPYGSDVVAIGGTGRGADTALVVRPSHAKTFFETFVVETICRPSPRPRLE